MIEAGAVASPEIAWRDGLPADEYWAIDPSIKTNTPVDNRGLIVLDELIETAKEYICPEYVWDGPNDKHHLYYFEALYIRRERSTAGRVPAHKFRELAVNKALMPRRFHNVIHKVMGLPAMPNAQVMIDYVEAWEIAKSLFQNARNAVLADHGTRSEDPADRDQIDEEIMQEIMDNHFNVVSSHLGALSLLPLELRPFRLGRDNHASVSALGEVLRRGKQIKTHDVLLANPYQGPCNCLRCGQNSSIITPVTN